MSLVHETMITLLNRRFVSTYWDVFKSNRGQGDVQANKLQKSHKLQYGSIFTPEGKQVNAFGYSKKGFYRSLKSALKNHPELNWRTPEEKAILKKAADHPEDNTASFDAANLHIELMEFTEANRILDRILKADKEGSDQVRARYLKVYIQIQDFVNTRIEEVRKELLTLEGLGEKVPVDLRDDVSVLLISIDTKLKARGGPNPNSGFFNGYDFRPKTDVEAHLKKVQGLIAEYPNSNRLGEMYYLRGLCEYYSGKKKEANDTWKKHFTEFPEDRTAMLSRVHHNSYAYGFQGPPHGRGRMPRKRATLGVQVGQDMAVSKVMENSMAQKFGVQVGDKFIAINGERVVGEDYRAHMKVLLAALSKAKSSENLKSVKVERGGKELDLKLQ